MTQKLSKDDALARVMDVLKKSFAQDVSLEITPESDTVYRVKASAESDASIADGLEMMKVATLRAVLNDGVGVKLIGADVAEHYTAKSFSNDPAVRAGYEELARTARGG
jgi:hypothetical protein